MSLVGSNSTQNATRWSCRRLCDCGYLAGAGFAVTHARAAHQLILSGIVAIDAADAGAHTQELALVTLVGELLFQLADLCIERDRPPGATQRPRF